MASCFGPGFNKLRYTLIFGRPVGEAPTFIQPISCTIPTTATHLPFSKFHFILFSCRCFFLIALLLHAGTDLHAGHALPCSARGEIGYLESSQLRLGLVHSWVPTWRHPSCISGDSGAFVLWYVGSPGSTEFCHPKLRLCMAWDPASFPWDWDADSLLIADHESCTELRKSPVGSNKPHDTELSVVRNGTHTFTGRDMCPAVPKTRSMSPMKHVRWEEGGGHIDADIGVAMANTYGVFGSASAGQQGTDLCMAVEKPSTTNACSGNGSLACFGNACGVQSLFKAFQEGVQHSGRRGEAHGVKQASQLPTLVQSELHQANFDNEKAEAFSTNVMKENDNFLESSKPAFMDEQHSSNATVSAGSGDSLTGLQLGKRTYPLDVTRVAVSKAAQKPSMAAKKARTTVAVPRCQVEGCKLDLTSAKDYHRRHKVCEPHSKTEKVIVASIEQRFCQQCSRFHLLAEFDEAKRSCRRRLAGHNKRRRKPHPDPLALHARMHSLYQDWSFMHQPRFSGMSLLWQDLDGFRSGGGMPCTTSLVEDQPAYEYTAQGLAMGGRPGGQTNGLLPLPQPSLLCDDKLSLLLLQSPKVVMPNDGVHPSVVHRWPLGALGGHMGGDTLTLAPSSSSTGGGVMPGLNVTTLVTRGVTRVSDSGRALSLLSMQPSWSSHDAPGFVKLERPDLTPLTTMGHNHPHQPMMMHEDVLHHHQPFPLQAASIGKEVTDFSYAPDLNRQASSYTFFTPMPYPQGDRLSGGRPA